MRAIGDWDSGATARQPLMRAKTPLTTSLNLAVLVHFSFVVAGPWTRMCSYVWPPLVAKPNRHEN